MNETVEPITEESRQLTALLSLLDDPEPTVKEAVKERLIEMGPGAAAGLRGFAELSVDSAARDHAEMLLREIGRKKFRGEIMQALALSDLDNRDIDLEIGVFAVALIEYPEIERMEYSLQLDKIAETLAAVLPAEDMSYQGSGMETMRMMNEYLIETLGFHGCRQENFYQPENSFLNRVMERRIGIPIALCSVYLLLAKRLNLPLYGVSFPSHFLLLYRSATSEFYVDPFNGGNFLTRQDCRGLLQTMGIEARNEYLEPVSNRLIVVRMIRNLTEIYRKIGPDLIRELEEAVVALSR